MPYPTLRPWKVTIEIQQNAVLLSLLSKPQITSPSVIFPFYWLRPSVASTWKTESHSDRSLLLKISNGTFTMILYEVWVDRFWFQFNEKFHGHFLDVVPCRKLAPKWSVTDHTYVAKSNGTTRLCSGIQSLDSKAVGLSRLSLALSWNECEIDLPESLLKRVSFH